MNKSKGLYSTKSEKMAKNLNSKPTSAELEILQILWQNGPSTVKYINEKQNELKEVGYTTTLKIMQIMNEKGLLKREKSGRSHIYEAVSLEAETQKVLIDKILQSAFGGSASKLVMQALGSRNTSDEEIEEIKKFIEQIERDKK
jgi:BlaI family penicillinase repressor